jgi:hypothetical protein
MKTSSSVQPVFAGGMALIPAHADLFAHVAVVINAPAQSIGQAKLDSLILSVFKSCEKVTAVPSVPAHGT